MYLNLPQSLGSMVNSKKHLTHVGSLSLGRERLDHKDNICMHGVDVVHATVCIWRCECRSVHAIACIRR
ncbi:mCG1041730 [Mus musculus]|nr:mCG1041730 [Mus musculus]